MNIVALAVISDPAKREDKIHYGLIVEHVSALVPCYFGSFASFVCIRAATIAVLRGSYYYELGNNQ